MLDNSDTLSIKWVTVSCLNFKELFWDKHVYIWFRTIFFSVTKRFPDSNKFREVEFLVYDNRYLIIMIGGSIWGISSLFIAGDRKKRYLITNPNTNNPKSVCMIKENKEPPCSIFWFCTLLLYLGILIPRIWSDLSKYLSH